jgi:hypothetical protein
LPPLLLVMVSVANVVVAPMLPVAEIAAARARVERQALRVRRPFR